jgi:NADPH-dependent ferric siderophore reductase
VTATIDPLSELSDRIVEHLNDEHADSVLTVARWLTTHTEAVQATALRVDSLGIELIAAPGDGRPTRVSFAEPANDIAGAQAQLIALIAEARRLGADGEPTGAERKQAEISATRTMFTVVRSVELLTPRMALITCAGGDLDEFTPIGPDQFVYLLAAPSGRPLAIDHSFSWETYNDIPVEDRPVGAYYTVRRYRPGEIELMVVLHGEHGEGNRWARRAKPGDEVALWGPRRVFSPPAGTDRMLLIGDETALPAMGAIIEATAGETPIDAICEVESPDDRLLPDGGAHVEWLYRGGTGPGTTDLLVEAVRRRSPAPSTYAWGGGESKVMTAVRTHLRSEVGLPREQVAMTAYWRLEGR